MPQVEVAYIDDNNHQFLEKVRFEQGMTVRQAIEASTVLKQFPEINLEKQGIGIFSKKVSLDDILQPGERVEIYRPLKISPMQKRRNKAKGD